MAKDINKLPYFVSSNKNKSKNKLKEKMLADFLLRKFKPAIRKKYPYHYLIQPIPNKSLKFINETAKQYPYFLYFDIRLYYPSVNHKIIIQKIPEIYSEISHRPPSRRMKKHLRDVLPRYLKQSPYNKGIPAGSRLSWALAGIFLLGLDLKIPRPFLRQADDYLLFCKNKNEPEKIIREIIIPELDKLKLELNEKKLSSGKFHQDKASFIGFNFHAGYFTIKENKKEEFKKKIIEITYLTKKKNEKATIKLLNNKILGFGHYYKIASCKKDFQDLDAFIRMRLRRWLLKQKELKVKESNLILTNQALKSMNLKSLEEIKNKIDNKNKREKTKNKKKYAKTGYNKLSSNWTDMEQKGHFYEQKEILRELKELTSFVKKIKNKLDKIN